MVAESGSRAAVPGPGGVVACVECQSQHVRPSGSSYPMDKEKNFEGKASFWRCSNCGARFMGPLVPERKHRHHRSHSRDPLGESVTLSRLVKRWAFPLIVILVTIIAVAFVLDRRNQDTRPRLVVTPPR
jgi:hypothetical protein